MLGAARAMVPIPANASNARRLWEAFVEFTGDVPGVASLWTRVACCMVDLRAMGQSRAVVGSFRSARYSDTKVFVSAQQTLIPKKRGPKPTGQGTPVMVRLQPNQLAALDAWISRQVPPPTRPAAVRQILADVFNGPPSKSGAAE